MQSGWLLEQAISTQREIYGWSDAIKKSAQVENVELSFLKDNMESEDIILRLEEYSNGVGKYSYGIGYPKCKIRDEDFIFKKCFSIDEDGAFYRARLPERFIKRLTKEGRPIEEAPRDGLILGYKEDWPHPMVLRFTKYWYPSFVRLGKWRCIMSAPHYPTHFKPLDVFISPEEKSTTGENVEHSNRDPLPKEAAALLQEVLKHLAGASHLKDKQND